LAGTASFAPHQLQPQRGVETRSALLGQPQDNRCGVHPVPLQPVLNPLKIYEMKRRTAKSFKEKLYFLPK
jgi:hypothetical protein